MWRRRAHRGIGGENGENRRNASGISAAKKISG
jgi:hypothetical protein